MSASSSPTSKDGDNRSHRRRIFDAYRRSFVGVAVPYPTYSLDGTIGSTPRTYLDSAATTLVSHIVLDAECEYLEKSLANSHTHAHLAARTTTAEIEEARAALARFVGTDLGSDVCIFTGNGATGALNLLARALFPPILRWFDCQQLFDAKACERLAPSLSEIRSELLERSPYLDAMRGRPKVITTMMEHHSNILPWVNAVGNHNVLYCRVRPDAALDMDHLAELLEKHGDETRLLAVTGISNVTGIKNPIHEIARMAHEVGAEIVVDAAQMAAHAPIDMHPADEPGADIDYLVISGHKVYAPGSRGGLIARTSTFLNQDTVGDVGGGMVEFVSLDGYQPKADPSAREEAGTPNIPGTIRLGLSLEILRRIGMDLVAAEEDRLVEKSLRVLTKLEGVTLYGSTDPGEVPRAGVFAFNVDGLHHGFVAAVLNDYFNIAVRNECFCAHPYVKQQLGIDSQQERFMQAQILLEDRRCLPGMVRASLGIYSTLDDIERLADALRFIAANAPKLDSRYSQDRDGDFIHHRGFHQEPPFTVTGTIDRELDQLLRSPPGREPGALAVPTRTVHDAGSDRSLRAKPGDSG